MDLGYEKEVISLIEVPIKIVIADDILPIREYLKMILTHEANFQVIKLVSSGREAIESCRILKPDVVLMDIEMGTPLAGIEAIRKIKNRNRKINCVVLADYCDDDTVLDDFRAGASNYIPKDAAISEMVKVIHGVKYESTFKYNQAI